MFDAYAAARESAANLLRHAGIAEAHAEDVRACMAGYELSSALPRRLLLSPEACFAAVCAAEAEAPAALCNAPAFSNIALQGGHICFALTNAAYAALMRAVEESGALPALPEDTAPFLPYMIARMRMLARKAGADCPDDPAVRHALWLCFGIAEAGLGFAQCQARALRAAHALAALGRELPPRERAELFSRCGALGRCAARLLALALPGI